jgi:hypothetical protein
MKLKKINDIQSNLFSFLKNHISNKESKPYSDLKNLCDCRSFDASFNALLNKGYVIRDTSKESNSFLLHNN